MTQEQRFARLDSEIDSILDGLDSLDATPVHLSISVTDPTTIILKNDSGSPDLDSGNIEVKYRKVGEPWEVYRGPGTVPIPFPGDYEFHFPDQPLALAFGSDDSEHRAKFTSIRFHQDFDISGVMDMGGMFRSCPSLTSTDLEGWDFTSLGGFKQHNPLQSVEDFPQKIKENTAGISSEDIPG